jgi:hypothetical protein
LGVGGEISSAGAGAEIIGIIKVGAKLGIKVGTKVGIATAEEIGRTGTGLIVRVFRGFKVGIRGFKIKVGSFSKFLTLKEAGSIVAAGADVCDKREV